MVPLFANRWLIAVPPIWLLGIGALLTVVVVLASWGLLRLALPRAGAEARASLGDGFLGPFAWLLLTLSAIALAGTPLVPLPQIGRSLMRMVTADRASTRVVIAPHAALQEIVLDVRPQELLTLEILT